MASPPPTTPHKNDKYLVICPCVNDSNSSSEATQVVSDGDNSAHEQESQAQG